MPSFHLLLAITNKRHADIKLRYRQYAVNIMSNTHDARLRLNIFTHNIAGKNTPGDIMPLPRLKITTRQRRCYDAMPMSGIDATGNNK